MIFTFVVRHFRWMARLPLVPHFFDAFLLAWTSLFHRERLRALETIETQVSALPGVNLGRHRFGGISFISGEREFAHLHGNGLLDVLLTRNTAGEVIASGGALPHHVFGCSAWISFWVRSVDDVPAALGLVLRSLTLKRAESVLR